MHHFFVLQNILFIFVALLYDLGVLLFITAVTVIIARGNAINQAGIFLVFFASST